jgi:hypothetical protein
MIATILGILCVGPLIPVVLVVAALIAWGCSSSDEADDDQGSKAKDTPLRPGSKSKEASSTADVKPTSVDKFESTVPGKSEILPLIPNLNCCSIDEDVAGVDVCDATESEDVYGRTTYEFTKKDGKYAGVFHDSMRSVALLASDMDTGELADWYVVRPQDTSGEHESGGILSDSNVVKRLVSFGNVCHVDTLWTSANATRPVVSAGPEGTVNIDFDGAEGLSDTAEQTMIFGAFKALNVDGKNVDDNGKAISKGPWNAYKMAYFGFAFAQMQESFRDDYLVDSAYRSTLIDSLSKTEMKGTGDERSDGILSLVYSFAPTMVDPENSEFNESKWVAENINHMGDATGQEAFAKVLIAGYSLHRAEDALNQLKAGKDSMDPVAFDEKKKVILDNLAAVNSLVGLSGKMEAQVLKEIKASESDTHPLKPGKPRVTKGMLENEYQKPFMTVIQDRAYHIYKELAKLSAPEPEPKPEPKPKKPKPKPKPEPKPKPKPKPKPEPKPEKKKLGGKISAGVPK